MKIAGPYKKMFSDVTRGLILRQFLTKPLEALPSESAKKLCIDSAECGACRRLTESYYRFLLKNVHVVRFSLSL